jgi:F-type H+-transporting ATPase subunit b
MDIDFAQVITQIFAFLIVFFVMRKFGWKPILDVLNERKTSIRCELEEIEKQKADVARMHGEYKQKLAQIDAEGRMQIREIVKEGRRLSQDIQDAAKLEAKQIVQKAKDQVEREIKEAKSRIKNEMVTIAIKATEKILEQSIDTKKHEAMIAQFVENAELK